MILSYFSQKTGFDISSKLSPLESVGLKCQIMFSEEKKKKRKLFQYVVCFKVYRAANQSLFKDSIFLKNIHFIIQERFVKSIYGINTIIKCST